MTVVNCGYPLEKKSVEVAESDDCCELWMFFGEEVSRSSSE